MIVTLGNSARRHSALCMYNDCSFRAATTNTSSRCGRSRIAATAIDHIGANPVPLATRTMLPEWFGLRKALPNADFSPQLRGYNSVRESADVKMQHPIVSATLERIGRAVTSRRKPPKLRLAELT